MEIEVTSDEYLSCVNYKLLTKTCKLFKEQLNGRAISTRRRRSINNIDSNRFIG